MRFFHMPAIGKPLLLSLVMAISAITLHEGAKSQQLRIDSRDCRVLAADATTDPSVAYQPGVDVRGRPVAPADPGGGSPVALPEVLEIPITVDMAERYGIDLRGIGAEATAGRVTFKKGRAHWNGRPMAPEDAALIRRRCAGR